MKQNTLTHEDRTRKLEKKAHLALMNRAGIKFCRAKTAAEEMAKLAIVTAEQLRSCGVDLLEAGAPTGQHQIEWWNAHKAEMPPGWGFNALKVCVHLAKRHESPITKLEDARAAIQLAFEGLNLCEAPRRLSDQHPHESNPWDEFVSRGASFLTMFDELEKPEPMDHWSQVKLQKFIATTFPIVQKHEEAKALLS